MMSGGGGRHTVAGRPLAQEGEEDKKGFDVRLMWRLLGYLKPYVWWVAFTFVLILIASMTRQAGPYLTKIGVDDYIVPGKVDGFGTLILIYVALLVVQFIVGYYQSWATNMIGQWAMRDVRLELFSHLQELPLQYFDRTPIGRLMAMNTSDVDALNEMFTDSVVSILSDILSIVAILGYIFYMDVQLGIVTCLAIPIGSVATVWLQAKSFQSFRIARLKFASFAASLQETISGMEVVQLFGFEKRRADKFEEGNDDYLGTRLTGTMYHSLYFPFMELSGVMLMGLVIWIGGGRVVDGYIEWGVLVAMLQYVPRFFMPIRDIADRFMTLQVAMASSERIFELLKAEPEPEGGDHRPEEVRGEIEFQNVWFAYVDEDWILKDVSFRVDAGNSLALVGATGAGKSTIINLVCGFYPIQKGAILVDGVDIREWDPEELRRRVGVVQQDVFLFAGDIETNISLGSPDVSDERVRQAAHDVNADRFIDKLPDGYQQQVHERGVSLSVGQRQLLSFARALAADPDVLVLDEATSNVDTETEVWIQEAVERLMSFRTSIVIAHRLSTIRNADKILVLHNREIREEGRHEELLEQRGIYYRLHQLQYQNGE
ncbi:MAG: antibiotic ABC transporter ATP-binding protein [Gemmatimonadetes bacterium]|nr:antibiotic ABC transporter ATP-binding protein [Gemmatimonadota bacterium]